MASKKKTRRSRKASSRKQLAAKVRSAPAATRLSVAKTYKIYIDGKFPRTESGRYYRLPSPGPQKHNRPVLANVCRASRKDFRNAVVAARKATGSWATASAYLRGQILYRIAEILEGRSEQFIAELIAQGINKRDARAEVTAAIERLVYYAGWSDKYQQIFSSVNPVGSAHFNFSVLEPMGVVCIIAPESSGLLGLVSNLAPVIVGGNTCVVLASESLPLCAVSFSEVLHASDVPAGVVNVLTGFRDELATQFASHMDANALIHCDLDESIQTEVEQQAAVNIKRVVSRVDIDWISASAQNPYFVKDTQEIKTTWHPIGG